ncbi:MAG: hypothetical protein OXJ37_23260 [Bryobacterales bacterium]|nr:hypothetical protein [Bryobacterales bacterium]MDE0620774.1 hypothetical protein [Bryobacterales bacterium]
MRKLVAAPGQAGCERQGEAPLAADSLPPDAVAEPTSPDFPCERLVLCLNPRLQAERRRKREDLLQSTEQVLAEIAAAVRHKHLHGEAAIERRIGQRANRYKVRKHLRIEVSEDELAIERAFRASKSHLRVRPLYVYSEDHVRGHVLLCLLAYYVEWHMRRRLAPLLFEDDDPAAARVQRDSPVEPAQVSPRAQREAATKTTAESFPAYSFPTLLADLSSLALNRVVLPSQPQTTITVSTQPSNLHRKAFELLGVDPNQTVPITVTG